MALLATITSSSLDPSYAQHAKARSAKEHWVMRAWLFVAAAALAFATVLAMKNLWVEEGRTSTLSQLTEAAENAQATVDQLELATAELEETIHSLKQNDAVDEGLGASLGTASALRRAYGPGVQVTVTEAVTTGQNPAVRDLELRAVVNSLWRAGAEAIAINGQRIGPQTNIRLAGAAVLVNLHAVSSPYVVEAIGDPDALSAALQGDGAVLDLSRRSGVAVSVSPASALALPALGAGKTWHIRIQGEGEDA